MHDLDVGPEGVVCVVDSYSQILANAADAAQQPVTWYCFHRSVSKRLTWRLVYARVSAFADGSVNVSQ